MKKFTIKVSIAGGNEYVEEVKSEKLTDAMRQVFGMMSDLEVSKVECIDEKEIFTKSLGAKGSAHDPYIESPDKVEDFYGNSAKFFKRVPFVYAHGKLENDLGSDIFVLYNFEHEVMGLMGKVRDGFKTYYTNDEGKTEMVVFHLYMHPVFGHLTGVVTYASDKEAYAYGRKLVRDKPNKF